MELKADILLIIYKLISITEFGKNEEKFTKKISFILKKFLNDKKRIIRKYAGLCVNLICLKINE
jgi:hypothetical protein